MGSSYLGIVSPCSTCKNQRAVTDLEGRANICPRRSTISKGLDALAGTADDQVTASYYTQLMLTGTDDDPSLTASLKNPVYDTDNGSVLVWIALLKDNPATIDQTTGTVLNPPITDPSFDTDYIVCSSLPFTPNSDEHGYFLKGALKEGETAVVHENKGQYTADGTQLLHVAGSVDRASFLGSIKRNPVIEDNCPAGI